MLLKQLKDNYSIQYIKATQISEVFNDSFYKNTQNITKFNLDHAKNLIVSVPEIMLLPIIQQDSEGLYSLVRHNKDFVNIAALYTPDRFGIDPELTTINPVKNKKSIKLQVSCLFSKTDGENKIDLFEIIKESKLTTEEIFEFAKVANAINDLVIPLVVVNFGTTLPSNFCPTLRTIKQI